MSIMQLKSINERKLKTRAEAYARTRVVCNRTTDANEKSWMAGYITALEDVRKMLNERGGDWSDVGRFLEEMP